MDFQKALLVIECELRSTTIKQHNYPLQNDCYYSPHYDYRTYAMSCYENTKRQ